MFDVGFGEFAVLALLGLLIFGPNQLPKFAAQAGRAVRQLRQMATSATDDLRAGLPEEYRDFNPADLNPRTFIRKHLWEDEEDGIPSASSLDQQIELAYGERPPFDAEGT